MTACCGLRWWSLLTCSGASHSTPDLIPVTVAASSPLRRHNSMRAQNSNSPSPSTAASSECVQLAVFWHVLVTPMYYCTGWNGSNSVMGKLQPAMSTCTACSRLEWLRQFVLSPTFPNKNYLFVNADRITCFTRLRRDFTYILFFFSTNVFNFLVWK